jgi:hypothetical protein
MGDARSYDRVCALRAVTSTDGSFAFDHSFLATVATRIVNEVPGINRVDYDVTSKPPGTRTLWEGGSGSGSGSASEGVPSAAGGLNDRLRLPLH